MTIDDLDLDTSMGPTQQSQYMRERFPPQGRINLKDYEASTDALKEFNDALIARNNAENGDEGVTRVLLTLEKPSIKALHNGKNIKREHVVATLGFLNGIGLQEATAKYKKPKVDEVKEELVRTYNKKAPRECNDCKKSYNYIGV